MSAAYDLQHKVSLTKEQLEVLADKCPTDEVVLELDKATSTIRYMEKYSLDQNVARFVRDVFDCAVAQKALDARPCRINRCPICGAGPHIILYQSGRNKGREKSRIGRSGYEFAERVVSIAGYPTTGCCADCFHRLSAIVSDVVSELECQVSERITGHKNRWARWQNRECSKCGWEGHEGQMGRRRTLFGDGTYPSTCPECKAVNEPLGLNVIVTVPGFTVTEVKTHED